MPACASARVAFVVGDWIMDSGAFTEISKHGRYRHSVAEYAAEMRHWRGCGNLLAAVAQDYMCEPFIVAKTGLSVAEHQRLTIERYDALIAERDGRLHPAGAAGLRPREYARTCAPMATGWRPARGSASARSASETPTRARSRGC
jgi:hypothetical protein